MPLANFNVQIDEQLKARIETIAQRIHVGVDELVSSLIEDWLLRVAPDSPDVSEAEALLELRHDQAMKEALRGDLVPQDEFDAAFNAMLTDARQRQGLKR
ncbi:hypothetical protein [Roseateles aquatilis]|nr:hypothetical protein [Roseateles aquatilis]